MDRNNIYRVERHTYVVSEVEVEFPPMRQNPFALRPLRADEGELFVGRDAMVRRIFEAVRFGTPRHFLIKGPRGGGRTSLLGSVAGMAELSYIHSMLPEDGCIDRFLSEMYCSLVGFESPNGGRASIIDQIIASTTPSSSGQLALIMFDDPSLAPDVFSGLFKRTQSLLRRLDAVIVVAVTDDQYAQFDEHLVDQFEVLDPVAEFDDKVVASLIEARIQGATSQPWSAPEDLIAVVMEQSGGLPAKVVRLMRDYIDVRRLDRAEHADVTELRMRLREKSLASEVDQPVSLPSQGAMVASAGIATTTAEWTTTQQTPSGDSEPATEAFEAPLVDEGALSLPPVPWVDEQAGAELTGGGFTAPPPSVSGSFGGLSQRHRVTTDAMEDAEMRSLGQIPVPEPKGHLIQSASEPIAPLIADIPAQVAPPLDIHLLKKNEISLLLRARVGPLSPSDGELLEHLGVGRPRLSQILNHLTREGWLISRKEGRRRLFELNTESAALIAELVAREVG
ncbi:MAG: hypothetical protein CMB77_08005 [Euryarchaeota archaeon]|nr:hypothetical protein [Euryarchaeota archaeon]